MCMCETYKELKLYHLFRQLFNKIFQVFKCTDSINLAIFALNQMMTVNCKMGIMWKEVFMAYFRESKHCIKGLRQTSNILSI